MGKREGSAFYLLLSEGQRTDEKAASFCMWKKGSADEIGNVSGFAVWIEI